LHEGVRIPLAKPDDEDQLLESPFNYVDAKTPLLQRAIDEQRARLKRR
jgi:hypothetical protein